MTYAEMIALLKERRMEQGLTQVQLGERLELKSPSASISLRESGKASMNVEELVKHAQAVQCTILVVREEDAALLQELIAASPEVRAHIAGLVALLKK